jgi:hypothetical protein
MLVAAMYSMEDPGALATAEQAANQGHDPALGRGVSGIRPSEGINLRR